MKLSLKELLGVFNNGSKQILQCTTASPNHFLYEYRLCLYNQCAMPKVLLMSTPCDFSLRYYQTSAVPRVCREGRCQAIKAPHSLPFLLKGRMLLTPGLGHRLLSAEGLSHRRVFRARRSVQRSDAQTTAFKTHVYAGSRHRCLSFFYSILLVCAAFLRNTPAPFNGLAAALQINVVEK